MKKIAISQRLQEIVEYNETREALDVRWGQLLYSANLIPVAIPTLIPIETFLKEVKVDGFILSGGNDLSQVTQSHLSKTRDNLERKIIQFSIDKKIPLLGVCRGMQIIGNYFGLTLKPINNHSGTSHEIQYLISHDPLIDLLIMNVKRNSYHDYALENTNSDLLTVARSMDGAIEAIKHKNFPIFAHMWHPERNKPFLDEDVLFLKKFFE